MNFLKKCTAALLAGIIALSCTACSSDTAWIMQKGELEMPAGVYLNNLIQSYYDASMKVEDSSKSVLSGTIEGQKAADWIKENALNQTKIDMAICSKFNDLGLEFTLEELSACHSQAESYYEKAGENMEKNGISQNSIELLYQLNYMKVKVFDAIYGEGGEKEIPESEIRDYYNNNYIKMAVQTFNLPAERTPEEDATDEEKEALKQMNETELSSVVSEADRLYLQGQIGRESGKEWNDILNQYKKNNQTGDTEYDMTTNNYRLLDTATTVLDEEVVTALKEAELGEMVKVRTDTMIAVGATTDINEDPTDFEYVRNTICHSLKEDEFEQYLLEVAQGDEFVVNEKAVSRYQPSKLKFN